MTELREQVHAHDVKEVAPLHQLEAADVAPVKGMKPAKRIRSEREAALRSTEGVREVDGMCIAAYCWQRGTGDVMEWWEKWSTWKATVEGRRTG